MKTWQFIVVVVLLLATLALVGFHHIQGKRSADKVKAILAGAIPVTDSMEDGDPSTN